MYIRARFVVVVSHAQRMFRPRGHDIAQICGECQGLVAPMSVTVGADRQKRRIGDTDPDLLHRRYQIRFAVFVLAQDGGEQADQALSGDARPLVQPGSVGKNFEAGFATMGWIPFLDWGKALFGRRPVPRMRLERSEQLLQGRSVVHDSAEPDSGAERHKTAPIQASFKRMSKSDTPEALVADAEAAGETLARVRDEIGKAVFGQERVIELTLAAILGGGHVLLVGAPGLAKTRLVEAMARVLGLDWARVQFTPDLMPADILGSEVLDQDEAGRRHFRFVQGPIFTQLLMADEINRASPRTQSALLQAMQEHHVTIGGQAHDVPTPFHVLATQNPIEHEGAYPLPEAQLDRFLLQVDVPYPDAEIERKILIETTGLADVEPQAVLNPDALMRLQRLVRSMPVGEKVLASILELVRSARPGTSHDPRVNQHVAWGPGPRAGQALMLAVRARALLRGRLAPSVDDVAALARPALAHRMQLSFGARAEGLDIDTLVDELAERAA